MKLTPFEKRKLLATYAELESRNGSDISFLFGKPLSYFDYDKISILIAELENELENQ